MGAEIEAEARTVCHKGNLDSVNIIAEIPGLSEPGEMVMPGGHRDSASAAWGGADYGSGCAVMTGAVRILEVADLPPDRTVRIAPWGGEGQGPLGPEANVKHHVADPGGTMQLGDERAKSCACFNADNATGEKDWIEYDPHPPLEHGRRQPGQAADRTQASTIPAVFAYRAATREELLPRKPSPKPLERPQAKDGRHVRYGSYPEGSCGR